MELALERRVTDYEAAGQGQSKYSTSRVDGDRDQERYIGFNSLRAQKEWVLITA
jgi:hypothetical protein